MLIALAVLFSEFGFLGFDKAACSSMAMIEKCFGGLEEETFEDAGILCASLIEDENLALQDFFAFSFSTRSVVRILSVHPSGWVMPTRI